METLAALAARHAPAEGANFTALPEVALYRRSLPSKKGPAVYTRSVFLVAQGRKQAQVGEQIFTYDPSHYLVTAVPLPVASQVLEASPEQPFLSVRLEPSMELIRELLSAGQERFAALPPGQPQRGLAASAVSPPLLGALRRLLELLDSPDLDVLGPLVLREITYRVLIGPQGGFLRALALGHGREAAISAVLLRLHGDCASDWQVPDLAAEAGMSETVFYEAFRAVTGSSPLQYIKRLRLLTARHQLRVRPEPVSQVAYRVGYRSPSQFSREFKRLFGVPPSQLTSPA